MVTKEEVLGLMRPLDKIRLIKELRTKTGLLLRDAKDAVEAALEVPLSDMQREISEQDQIFEYHPENYTSEQLRKREEQMLALFGFVIPVAQEPETAPEGKMRNAINCVIDNWKVLGFDSAKDAVLKILGNF